MWDGFGTTVGRREEGGMNLGQIRDGCGMNETNFRPGVRNECRMRSNKSEAEYSMNPNCMTLKRARIGLDGGPLAINS
jgi:hypothetical protein